MSRAEAIRKLGSEDNYINAKGYQTERQNAQDRYNSDYNNLQTKYNELVNQAEENKRIAKSDFNTNRLAVDSDAYMSTRGKTGADLSSRGLSEGFGTAGKMSTMLARNNASADLANTYYNSMADIQKQMDIDTQDYNYNINNLKLDLDNTLANINAREAAARNAYRAQVAQLAEQIAARNAAQKYYDDQLALQLQDSQYELAKGYVKDTENTNSSHIIDEANRVVSSGKAVLNDGTKVTNTGQALKWLQENNRYRLADVQKTTKIETNKRLADAYNKEQSRFSSTTWYVDEDGNLRQKPKWWSTASGVSK